ncbi:MAG: HypC/HybG/HupF family hydrogenase formation chaperone [Alphaproteobacteria bacterium]|nr:HypC/HybG/HupF family hydrogenase formation chaperone [Alphaproteobacteria bacterium]
MCLAIPGELVSIDASGVMPMGVVRFAGVSRTVCLACTPEARVGDYVVVHAGYAMAVVDAAAAQETLALLGQ